MANIKLGADTLTGVNKIRVRNADADGQYVEFPLPTPTQEKAVSITANGTTEVTPDSGYALSKVTITTDVSGAVAGTYVISFNVLGAVVGSMAIPQGQSLTANPYVPTDDGYTFIEWQIDGTAVSYPHTPTANETWTANMLSSWRFGVSGLGNSSPTLTRTYDNVGKTYNINSSAGTITTDFDNIFNFETVVQNGNTMIKIPVMYKHFDTITGNQLTAFSISNAKIDDEWQPYPCFVKQDGSGDVMPYILISKGKATGTSSKATCVSGSMPLVNVTRAQARTAARANGTGWQQFDWMMLQLIRDLFCVVFATTNSQSIFLGMTTGFSAAASVGGTWNISTPCGWNTSTMQNRFFGIEDIFGNVWDWCDGVTFSSSTVYSTVNPSLFSDSTSNMINSGTRSTSNGYVSKLNYSTAQPFMNYVSAASGSDSTYYADNSWYGSGGVVLFVGGGWYNGSNAGLWSLNGYYSASASDSDIGARLSYRPL